MATTGARAARAPGRRLPATAKCPPSKKYAGHRLGRVFKLGLAGLGYYADNGPVVQVNLLKGLFALMEAPPVPIALYELACGKGDAVHGGRDEPFFHYAQERA